MTHVVETFEHKGHTVEIVYDDDGSASNPRDYCNVGTFVGFTHRSYSIGDEQINPGDCEIDCTCDGGTVTFPIMGEQVERDCTRCEGYGSFPVRTFADMTEWIKARYDVVGDVYPVAMYEHGGVAYRIGTAAQSGDRWDTSDAGVIFATPEQVTETGVVPEDIEKALTLEIEEYSRWANGEVYGYRIYDRNGDEIEDSCWGLIGMEWAEQAAREAVPDEVPARTRPVR